MFGRKTEKVRNNHNADSGLIFERTEIDFCDFRTYCSNFTENGDWIIPISGDFAPEAEYVPGYKNEDDDEYFMRTYDEDLVSIYRHQDDNLVVKNVKMLGGKNPKNKGLIFNIYKIMGKIDKIVSRLPRKTTENICGIARKAYDGAMKDSTTGQVPEIHIWIPLWRTKCEKALLIHILDRINVIIT